MAKMTRDSLKSLVKECLFEILLESTGGDIEKLNEVKSSARPAKKRATRRPALDNVRMERAKPTPAPSRKIDVSGITQDPVMAAIFEDTAATTLVEQAAAERGKPQRHADAAAHAVSNSDPSQLFGKASENWAALAFADK